MKKNNRSYILVFCVLHVLLALYSLTGIFSKLASKEEFFGIPFISYYSVVLLILGVYAVVWQQLIKKLPLTLAYANKAVTVVWGMIWGILVFHEQITPQKIIGAVVVIIGVVIYSLENQHERN